jgi:hypothetical protein
LVSFSVPTSAARSPTGGAQSDTARCIRVGDGLMYMNARVFVKAGNWM